jgi:hypothetical protein
MNLLPKSNLDNKLHITISKGMFEGNLSAIRSACEQAIKESSPEKTVKKYSKEKVVKQSSPELKKPSPEEKTARQSHGRKHIFKFPTSEDIGDDWEGKGILFDGRRPSGSEENK